MKFFLCILLLLGAISARADFVAGIGLEGSTSGESNRGEFRHNSLFGVRGDFEIGFKYLTLHLSGAYSFGTADSDYQLTDPNNASNTATAEGLETTLGLLRLGVGARLMLIRSQRFRFFAGGGGLYGALALMYDKDEYYWKTGSTNGLKSTEAQALKGSYLEAGMDFIFTKTVGMRLLYQKTFLQTDAFETLNNKELDLQTNYFSLNYIQYVDTKW
ncbi:hypothetical protein [Peredibacter starrii]|uniref:Outer membrane protein beta-barrel domain-containing protein n=1 Tax=Peredibacter starrii TaxID=28202 RepID=A0AAX4HMI5_9BACT|nr:hypothetical protein [Peredibacter starrii]WPU64431.1 hypothetical protein SOO65_17190 [Peredibacter starrii]